MNRGQAAVGQREIASYRAIGLEEENADTALGDGIVES